MSAGAMRPILAATFKNPCEWLTGILRFYARPLLWEVE